MRKLRLLKERLGKRRADLVASAAESSSSAKPVTASSRSERYGLMPLAGASSVSPSPGDPNPNPEQCPVDVVAIHGLNGDAYTTWTHENGTLWLRDLLPPLLPGCRVFTYGYPSQVAFSTSFSRVQEYARQLLCSLRDLQEQSKVIIASIFLCLDHLCSSTES